MARYAKFFSLGGGGGTNNLQLPVGTILDATLRQVQDGTGTGSPLYLSTLRLGITSDSSVTTQTSSVIQATTTNANLVIAPNGTGALVASIPDGTIAGGNARGNYAVDLQMVRTNANQVASSVGSTISGGVHNRASGDFVFIGGGGNNNAGGSDHFQVIVGGNTNTITAAGYSFIGGGGSNTIANGSGTGFLTIVGGQSNLINGGTRGFIGGGQSNNVSSSYSVVNGGQSNTASTGTHATVVGGNSNTASGQYSVAGGTGNSASGNSAVAFGNATIASGLYTTAIGNLNNATATASLVHGVRSLGYITAGKSIAAGRFSLTGDAQSQETILRNVNSQTFTTGATTVLGIDVTGTIEATPLIPSGNNRMWKVKVEWVATVTTITGTATGITVGDYVYGESSFGFKKLAGTSTMGNMLSDSEASDNAIMDTCLMTYTAGASQELALTFTGPTFSGGGSVTMRVVAKVSLVEVAF